MHAVIIAKLDCNILYKLPLINNGDLVLCDEMYSHCSELTCVLA